MDANKAGQKRPKKPRLTALNRLDIEACLNDGDSGNAEVYLNKIRVRAHLPEKHGITMDDIKIERRLELAMEGFRYQDLKRWGDAETVLADKGKKIAKFEIKVPAGHSLTNADADYFYNANYTTTLSNYNYT